MDNNTQANPFAAYCGIVKALASLDAADGATRNDEDILTACKQVNAAGLSENTAFLLGEAINGITQPPATNSEIRPLLAGVREELAQLLPRFRVVLLDETEHWTDEGLKEKAGKIWGAYLYNEARVTYAAEITPSYELKYLYSTAQNRLPDDMEEMLLLYGAGDDPYKYMHCRDVDAIGWDRKRACHPYESYGDAATATDTYEELFDDVHEAYRANIGIDIPSRPDLANMLDTSIEYLQRCDPKKGAVLLSQVMALPDAAAIPALKEVADLLERSRTDEAMSMLEGIQKSLPSQEMTSLMRQARLAEDMYLEFSVDGVFSGHEETEKKLEREQKQARQTDTPTP